MLSRSVIPAGTAPEGKRGDLLDWRQDAACRDYPLTGDDDPWHVPKTKQADSPAMQVCWEVCPVRETCLDESLGERSQNVHGIRGGHTAAERKTMIRKRYKARFAAKQAAEAAAAAEASKAA